MDVLLGILAISQEIKGVEKDNENFVGLLKVFRCLETTMALHIETYGDVQTVLHIVLENEGLLDGRDIQKMR